VRVKGSAAHSAGYDGLFVEIGQICRDVDGFLVERGTRRFPAVKCNCSREVQSDEQLLVLGKR